MAKLLLACCLLLAPAATAKVVKLSNRQLPRDQHGRSLLTGEASALEHAGSYYFYFNNWGGCRGLDCCPTVGGCASCCMRSEGDKCVYANNHSVVVYRTADFESWDFLGVALSREARLDGVEFRPCVVHNKATGNFVMWYEDRHPNQQGYAIAVSKTPEGPFSTVVSSLKMHGQGRSDGSGDFNLLVDDDGAAYHVRDGFVVERLTPDYLAGTGEFTAFTTPLSSEGPVFFKRNGLYYILPGTACCACRGGSTIYVYIASKPLGPYVYHGDIGRNVSQEFDPHSPYNFATHSQGSTIFSVMAENSGLQYVWMGNQWVSSTLPGKPRNQDLLYFSSLQFEHNGSIKQIHWQDEAELEIQDQKSMVV